MSLAGAFGNYVNIASARRIGLLNLPADGIVPAGNTALHGAKWRCSHLRSFLSAIAARVEHVGLSELPDFQDVYAEEMGFPLTDGTPP